MGKVDSMKGGSTPLDGAGQLCLMGARALAAAYADGSVSPVEVATAAIRRAETLDPMLNAFTRIDAQRALTAARASEARWRSGEPLSPADGIPTTIKDIVLVEGWPVRYGSTTTEAEPRKTDAPSVERLRKSGAVLFAQTTTPEFGWKAVTDSSLSGVTRNPWDPKRTAGGSSGGAAVAAATGAGVFHLGTDGGGSIRVPASFCGIFGLKPTYGRVAAYPASSFGTVAHIGPMTRTAEDAAVMLAVMAGRDLRDWTQGAGVLRDLSEGAPTVPGLRVGYWTAPPSGTLDPEVAGIVEAAAAEVERHGAAVEPVDLPGSDLLELFHRHWFTGAAARLAGIPGEDRAGIDPGFLEAAEAGRRFTAVQLMEAQLRRAEFGAAMDQLLLRYDVLLSPAVTVPPFEAGRETPAASGLARWTEWAAFSYPINLSQQPACSLPCGFTADGLPVGLQLVAARGAEARLLGVASALERLLARPQIPPVHATLNLHEKETV